MPPTPGWRTLETAWHTVSSWTSCILTVEYFLTIEYLPRICLTVRTTLCVCKLLLIGYPHWQVNSRITTSSCSVIRSSMKWNKRRVKSFQVPCTDEPLFQGARFYCCSSTWSTASLAASCTAIPSPNALPRPPRSSNAFRGYISPFCLIKR